MFCKETNKLFLKQRIFFKRLPKRHTLVSRPLVLGQQNQVVVGVAMAAAQSVGHAPPPNGTARVSPLPNNVCFLRH